MARDNQYTLTIQGYVDEKSVEESITRIQEKARKSDKFKINFTGGIDQKSLSVVQKAVKDLTISGSKIKIGSQEAVVDTIEGIDRLQKRISTVGAEITKIKKAKGFELIDASDLSTIEKALADVEKLQSRFKTFSGRSDFEKQALAGLSGIPKGEVLEDGEYLRRITELLNGVDVALKRVKDSQSIYKTEIKDTAAELSKLESFENKRESLYGRVDTSKTLSTTPYRDRYMELGQEIQAINKEAVNAEQSLTRLTNRFNILKAEESDYKTSVNDYIKLTQRRIELENQLSIARTDGKDTASLSKDHDIVLKKLYAIEQKHKDIANSEEVRFEAQKKLSALETANLNSYQKALTERYNLEIDLARAQAFQKENKYRDPEGQKKIIESINAQLRESIAEEEKWANVVGKSEQAAKKKADAISAYETAVAKANLSDKETLTITQNIVRGMKEATARVINYTIAYRALWFTISKFKESIQIAQELDKVMVDLQIATGGTAENTRELLITYNQFAKELGATTSEVAQAADAYLRMGMTMEDTNKLVKSSMYLSKLGQIESAQATEYLTSAIKGYKIEAANSMSVVDKLTKVDMEASVSAGYLAEAMSRTATSAQLAGIDMDTLIGYVATIGETTQKSASTVGESIKC